MFLYYLLSLQKPPWEADRGGVSGGGRGCYCLVVTPWSKFPLRKCHQYVGHWYGLENYDLRLECFTLATQLLRHLGVFTGQAASDGLHLCSWIWVFSLAGQHLIVYVYVLGFCSLLNHLLALLSGCPLWEHCLMNAFLSLPISYSPLSVYICLWQGGLC